MKDKREPILVLKGKDINLVIDAIESMTDLDADIGYKKLSKKIKEVMRIE